MKEGIIAQIVIGNFHGWEDRRERHPTGLDCRKLDNSIIIELKNRYNTCNTDSAKAVLDKLARYKKANTDTKCVWGIVNAPPGIDGLTQVIIHDGVEIWKIQGTHLFSLVFTVKGIDYSDEVIKYVQCVMKNDNETVN